MWCNCAAYCHSGKKISKSTWYKHTPYHPSLDPPFVPLAPQPAQTATSDLPPPKQRPHVGLGDFGSLELDSGESGTPGMGMLGSRVIDWMQEIDSGDLENPAMDDEGPEFGYDEGEAGEPQEVKGQVLWTSIISQWQLTHIFNPQDGVDIDNINEGPPLL
jgi:hypothetical protein